MDIQDVTEDISEEMKNNVLALLPNGTSIVKVESDRDGNQYFQVSNDGQETTIKVSTMMVMDRLKSCVGNIVVQTDADGLKAVYEDIVASEDRGEKLAPPFGVELMSEGEEDPHQPDYERPYSGEMLNVVIQKTIADIRPSVTAIMTEGVSKNFLVPDCGCRQLKTKLLVAGTVYGIPEGFEPVVDGKLNPELAERINGCIERDRINKDVSLEDLLDATVNGYKEDAIGEYLEIEVSDIGAMRIRIPTVEPKTE